MNDDRHLYRYAFKGGKMGAYFIFGFLNISKEIFFCCYINKFDTSQVFY